MTTINTAFREYAKRPADERYNSVDALLAAAADDKARSAERTYNLKDLRAVVSNDTVQLVSPKGEAGFTHWSFGQMSRMIGAPAAYLRDLPPALAADCINHGIQNNGTISDAQLLLKATDNGPVIRACTSESYGRVWDADALTHAKNQILSHGDWSLPPVWGGGVAGAYRGDRDSFLIVTNGGSIVTDPSLSGKDSGAMYRGIMIRNSEVGAASISIETVLFRYICGNHMLWGAAFDSRFKRRHVGQNALRATVREIGRIAHNWANQSAERDNAIIRGLIQTEIAQTKEAVIAELRKMGASKDDAEAAYQRCEQTENVSPRTYWGIAQGLTRMSQDSSYQSDRYELDQLAALVMSRGAKRVAA